MPRSRKIEQDRKMRTNYLANEKIKNFNTLQNFLIKKNRKKIKTVSTRINNRCILTGASRSVYSSFSLSRHSLRRYMNFGYLPAITPSSW